MGCVDRFAAAPASHGSGFPRFAAGATVSRRSWIVLRRKCNESVHQAPQLVAPAACMCLGQFDRHLISQLPEANIRPVYGVDNDGGGALAYIPNDPKVVPLAVEARACLFDALLRWPAFLSDRGNHIERLALGQDSLPKFRQISRKGSIP